MTQVTAPPNTLEVDPQDPLPESSWFWRRVFVFMFGTLATAALAAILYMLFGLGQTTLGLVGRLSVSRDVRALDQSLETIGMIVRALSDLGFWVVMLLLALHILYLIAPSAEQATKMLATVSAWKSGVSTSSSSKAVSPDGSRAESSQSATKDGPPAAAATDTDQTALPWRKS